MATVPEVSNASVNTARKDKKGKQHLKGANKRTAKSTKVRKVFTTKEAGSARSWSAPTSFKQIHLAFWTNVFGNWDKYISKVFTRRHQKGAK